MAKKPEPQKTTAKKAAEPKAEDSKEQVQDEQGQAVQADQDEDVRFIEVDKIAVTGPKRGRRRAGYAFNDVPTILEVGKLTPEEMDAISTDPMLRVEGA